MANNKVKNDLINKLNLNYLTLVNNTWVVGKHQLAHIPTPNYALVDYFALYSDKSEYHKTSRTAVIFAEYDNVIDGINGLWNAIYYNNEKRLNRFKERFKDVRLVVSPDYSMVGDTIEDFNIINQHKMRIVSIWFMMECGINVIPLITYATEKSFEYMLDGYEDAKIVCFSLKGSIKRGEQRELLIKAIKYTVDKLKDLNQIFVYSDSVYDSKVKKLFEYAIKKDISIVIPNNKLKNRNMQKMKK